MKEGRQSCLGGCDQVKITNLSVISEVKSVVSELAIYYG